MKNEKFNQTIDEAIGFVEASQKLQMDQLKANIKAVYEANVGSLDVNAIALQILDTPIYPAQPAIHLRDEMMCTAEKNVTIGSVGDLKDLSYVKVGTDTTFGKEFYHHCPEVQNNLVRLHRVNQDYVHECPVCGQKYEQK